MAIEKVIDYFEKLGCADKIKQFEVSSATVELATEALGCEGARIAKTLSFLVDGSAVLIVTAGDMKIDNHKFKEFFHAKAKMLSPEQVDELIGHSIGGVCPFAVNDGCKVYLDESLRRFEIVYPAAGNAASAIELTPEELEKYSGSLGWIDVCKS
ncbi:MAG: YbaK/EbsC family protein [Ruminococcaceae bacterium]|nr:YbaK/EbsC family protein [Oscillospiraceae bacterium]MBR3595635.1 YbaK/EbsC family protein [Clostridia bacterium]